MKLIKTKQLSKAQKLQLLTLWNKEYPTALNHQNQPTWDHKAFLRLGEGTSIGAFMKRVVTVGSRYFGLDKASLVRMIQPYVG